MCEITPPVFAVFVTPGRSEPANPRRSPANCSRPVDCERRRSHGEIDTRWSILGIVIGRSRFISMAVRRSHPALRSSLRFRKDLERTDTHGEVVQGSGLGLEISVSTSGTV